MDWVLNFIDQNGATAVYAASGFLFGLVICAVIVWVVTMKTGRG